MSNIDFKSIFNTKLIEFLQDLRTTFPNIPEFSTYETMTQASIMFNNDIASSIFKNNVEIPFGDKIDAKDDSFILDQKYEDADQSLVCALKKVWHELDQENKDMVWKHVQLLNVLSRKI
jgi:hypothetical protein